MTHDHETDDGHYDADFDAKAATWDDPTKLARARLVADAVVAATAPTPATRTFEYGAGTGLVTEALGERVGAATLADTSVGMRAVMADKVSDGRLRDATIIDLDLDAETVELPRHEFDLIVTVLVMHHVDNPDRVLGRFAEMLAHGGHLCIVDLDAEDGSFHGDGFSGHHGFDRGELTGLLHTAGFSNVTVSDCGSITRQDGDFPMFLAVAST